MRIDPELLFIAGAFSFAFGCVIASFLNVCIWRLPRNESVVRPGSHCPACNAPIRWWQNIPILSYAALRGRCARCGKPISLRYPLVETLGGTLFLLAWLQWAMPGFAGMAPLADPREIPVFWLVFAGLILGSFIDLDHFYLPDRVTIGGMVLGVPLSYLVPGLHGFAGACRLEGLYSSLAGMSLGFLLLWGVGWFFSKLFRKEALGFGDVKLLGAAGAFFGPVAVLFVLIVSSLAGAVAGGALILRGKARIGGFTAIPYGPFIALAILAWMFWGPRAVEAYVAALGVK